VGSVWAHQSARSESLRISPAREDLKDSMRNKERVRSAAFGWSTVIHSALGGREDRNIRGESSTFWCIRMGHMEEQAWGLVLDRRS